jgi:murein DD-endopeptidase MepM/ murein hydrolase activator NlpD
LGRWWSRKRAQREQRYRARRRRIRRRQGRRAARVGRKRRREWIDNSYSIPVTIDIGRNVANLRPSDVAPRSIVVPARGSVRAATWVIADTFAVWDEDSWLRSQFGAPSARPAPYLYALPFNAGESHRCIQGFHGSFSHFADSEFAVDFEMAEGTTVRAARDGVVVAYNDKASGHGSDSSWWGRRHANWVVVRHDDGTLGEYWHLMTGGVVARVGQRVARGDVIGRSGFTGYTTGPHLHFAITTAVDGVHFQSFRFAFKARPDDSVGEAPNNRKTYTAFE